jgi:hypothetical protein
VSAREGAGGGLRASPFSTIAFERPDAAQHAVAAALERLLLPPSAEEETMNARSLIRALGWFSLALGAAELVAPRRISRTLRVGGHDGLIRSYGLREIAAGLGLLLASRPGPWLWARVAGDVLDLGTLGAARRSGRRTGAVDAALASVAAVTAIDVAAAASLSRDGRAVGSPSRAS